MIVKVKELVTTQVFRLKAEGYLSPLKTFRPHYIHWGNYKDFTINQRDIKWWLLSKITLRTMG